MFAEKPFLNTPGGSMIRVRNIIIVILILLISVLPLASQANAQEPVIRAVLFYSQSCPHCLIVINEVIPPLVDQYGSQLQIFGVNTFTELGNTLFLNAVQAFNIPEERQAVPTLIVGDYVLTGSGEIPDLLPGIIEEGLNNGGIDWPAIPGLEQAMSETGSGEEESTTSSLDQRMTLGEKISSDLAGNLLAIAVLAGMIGSIIYVGVNIGKEQVGEPTQKFNWLIPVLTVLGFGIAAYLSFVEINQVEAVCGPVGDCNTVQQSSYAKLFGVLPIGILGLLGYLAVIILWLAGNLESEIWQNRVNTLLWIITLIGTLFSVYLTFLEPFVIGATCIWCIMSAIIMTILFLLTTRKFKQSLTIIPEES
jgi:uncharacterized membrane protein